MTYFGVGFSLGLAQLPANAPNADILKAVTENRDAWYLGAWLQATGSMLSIVFFVALVFEANALTKLSGILTVVGSTTLLTVVLIEGAFTIDLAQAAANGRDAVSLTSFDLMTVFTHIYPLAPAPLIFLSLGMVLLSSNVLPRGFAYTAFVLGIAFLIAGLISLFTIPWLVLVVLVLQSIWGLGAALAYLLRIFTTPTTK